MIMIKTKRDIVGQTVKRTYDKYEIDDFLKPANSRFRKERGEKEMNFLQAFFAALGLTIVAWAFLWFWFFITQPK